MSEAATIELLNLIERLPGDAQAELIEKLRLSVGSEASDGVLSIEEITERHHGRFVLLDQIDAEPGPRLRGGRVRLVSDDKKALYRAAMSLELTELAILYMGDLDPSMNYAL